MTPTTLLAAAAVTPEDLDLTREDPAHEQPEPGRAVVAVDAARPPGRLRRRLQLAGSQAGMTTAEYAVGTVAACGFGGVLYKVITNDRVLSAIGDLIAKALTLTF